MFEHGLIAICCGRYDKKKHGQDKISVLKSYMSGLRSGGPEEVETEDVISILLSTASMILGHTDWLTLSSLMCYRLTYPIKMMKEYRGDDYKGYAEKVMLRNVEEACDAVIGVISRSNVAKILFRDGENIDF